jgi:hypothetical protein
VGDNSLTALYFIASRVLIAHAVNFNENKNGWRSHAADKN